MLRLGTLIFIFLISVWALAQNLPTLKPTPSSPEATPTPPPPIPIMASPTPYAVEGLPDFWQGFRTYQEDIWKDVEEALIDSNWGRVLRLAHSAMEDVKTDSLEYSEDQLYQAYALYRLGFSYGASEMFADLARARVGTLIGEKALLGLQDIATNHEVDEDYLFGEILNDVEFGVLPQSLSDFVNYFTGQLNLQKGFEKWGKEDLKKVTPDSYWGLRLKYTDALRDVRVFKNDAAFQKFKEISEAPSANEQIKNDAIHQMARLIFEKGDYLQSYKMFKTVKLDPRERGFILLERAWSKYYQKDYSRALGLLQAFEAPMFDPARTPEAYILKMIMLKELCHYDAALEVMHEFKDRYQQSVNRIKKRADLRKDQNLVNMSLMDQHYEKWVAFLNLLREEKPKFDELGLSDHSFYSSIKSRYTAKMKEMELKLSRMLIDQTRVAAEKLLDWQEQLTFLDYQTRLDSLRVVKHGDELQYKSPVIPGLTFDRIYWIFDGEYWLDELEDMKSFIESRCSEESIR